MYKHVIGLLVLIVVNGCSALPPLVESLSKDKASLCGEIHGGPLGIPWGVTRFCRANSDLGSKLQIDKDGAIVIEHNLIGK